VVANAQAELAHALGGEQLTLAAFYLGGSSEHSRRIAGMEAALDCGKTLRCSSERSKLRLGNWHMGNVGSLQLTQRGRK
jgi:hypothetical protein